MNKHATQRLLVFAALLIGVALMIYVMPAPDKAPDQPCPPPVVIEPTYVPPVLPQPAPQPAPEPPKPRDVSTEPTAKLLAEWNAWRHGPAARTAEIQTTYEQLLKRNVIRRDGEPVSDGGRRRIGRRR